MTEPQASECDKKCGWQGTPHITPLDRGRTIEVHPNGPNYNIIFRSDGHKTLTELSRDQMLSFVVAALETMRIEDRREARRIAEERSQGTTGGDS